jgi:hypothetical protein
MPWAKALAAVGDGEAEATSEVKCGRRGWCSLPGHREEVLKSVVQDEREEESEETC